MGSFGFTVTEGADVAALAAIPGVRVRNGKVYASHTARALVAATGLPLRTIPKTAEWLPATAKVALGSLREWVPAFLTDYQREGVARVLAMPDGSGHFWWSAGSGKTLGAIVWALASHGRTVVVTKASVRAQWRSEVERFTTRRPRLIAGEQAEPLGMDDSFLILSYEILPAWIAEIERWGRGLAVPISVVFDESHKVKSHKRWDATPGEDGEKVKFNLKDNIAAAAHRLSLLGGRRLATTATPVRDRPRDLWAQLDLIHPQAWGGYWDFAKRYCNPPEAPIWMADYTFKPLGEVVVGDRVIGWERRHGPRTKKGRGRGARVLTPATVTAVMRHRAPIVKVTLASGRVIRCTPDHRWLTTFRWGSGEENPQRDEQIRAAVLAGKTYREAGAPFRLSVQSVWRIVHAEKSFEYLPVHVGRALCHVVDPRPIWLGAERARDAAWLAGIYDGEAHDNFIAQHAGVNPDVHAEIGRVLTRLHVPHTVTAQGYRILGGRDGLLRLQTMMHAVRFHRIADRTMLTGKFRTPDAVVSIEPDGEGEVIGLTTTTGNYVAWGYASKNCAARENAWGGWDDTGRSNEEELKARLALVAHRVKHSQANRSLPPKRRVITYVPPEEQSRPVGSIAAEIRNAAKLGGPALLEARLLEAAGRKRKRLIERVEEATGAKEKVIVFTGRRLDCDALGEEIQKKLPGVALWVGHGDHGPEEREVMRQAYMAHPGPCVLVGTIDAWGEGLNLQDTDLLLIAMLPYTPGAIVQAEGRVARLGQTRAVLVEYMVAEGTVDDHVAAILLGKLPAVERVIESEEVAGFARELSGADDVKVMEGLVAKILGGIT